MTTEREAAWGFGADERRARKLLCVRIYRPIPVTKNTGVWQCQECGKRLSTARAKAAMFGPNGCPRCGGSDFDLAELPTVAITGRNET